MPSDADNQDTHNAIVELESEHWRLHLEPQTGLQTQICQIKHQHQWVDVMPNCSPSATQSGTPLAASNFHMLPYSNRIRDGRFTHDGQQVQLENGENHAIHGALRKRAWRVSEQSSSSVSAEFDTQQDGAVNWPWPIHAVITYTLKGNDLISQMSLTNKGTSSMPAGMGWHPYFCRTITGADPELTIAVNGVYPDTDGDCLPIAAAMPLSSLLDFTKQRLLDPTQRIDHCLSGFASPAMLSWPSAGISIAMHASNNCTHLVLYNPDEDYFAVEPVTNANDAFNLAASGIDAGMQVLEPNETITAEMRLTLK